MPYLEFKEINMQFPGVKALDGVSFAVNRGEIVAFLGENGAGKSTLLKILNGDYQPTSGKIFVDGKEVSYANPNEAIRAGISVIYQERQLVPYLSVAENIFLGHLPVRGKLIDYKALNHKAQLIIDEFGLPISPSSPVHEISVAYQQIVEIMKAYAREAEIYCFDEPTAPLTDTEIAALFAVIRKLKAQQKAIIYVSHRINELFELTDQVVIFKDGRVMDIKPIAEANEHELIKLMVGRDIGDVYSNLNRNTHFGEAVLELDGICTDKLHDISMKIRAGEIVSLSGLAGAGRTEVARAIFGADPVTKGSMKLFGQPYAPKSPKEAMQAGVALAPEDRKLEGLFLIQTVRENISISILPQLTKYGFVNQGKEAEIVDNAIGEFNIKTPSSEQTVLNLSGGNQQKTILARWMSMKPKLIILDEPTKGIDVGAKSEIYQMICEVARQGIAVIFISSELPEVIGVSDRILVLKDGRITQELSGRTATEQEILTWAMLDKKDGGEIDE